LPYVMVWSGPTAIRIGIEDGQAKRLPITMPFDPIPGTSRVVSAEGITDVVTAKLTRRWQKRLRLLEPVAVSPDGKYAVIGSEDPGWRPPDYAATEAAYSRVQQLKVFRIADGRMLSTVPGFAAGSGWYGLITFPKPGLFCAPRLGWARDLRTGKVVSRYPVVPIDASDPSKLVLTTATGSWVSTFPPLPVSVHDGLVDGLGRVTVVRSRESRYRTPNISYGGGSVVSRIEPLALVTPQSVNLKLAMGKLSFGPDGVGFSSTYAVSGENLVKVLETRQNIYRAIIGQKPIRVGTEYRTDKAPASTAFTDLPSGAPTGVGQSTVPVDYVCLFTRDSAGTNRLTVWNKNDIGMRFAWNPPTTDLRICDAAVAISQDRIAVGLEDSKTGSGQIVILNARDGSEISRIAPPGPVRTQLWSPDGLTLVASGWGWVNAYPIDRVDAPVPLQLSGITSADLSDFSISWLPGDRIAYVNSLSPIHVVNLKSGLIESSAVFFADGNWRAWSAQGDSDGTAPPEHGPIRVWDGQRWQAAKSRSFWMKSLLTPASPRQTLRHQGPTAPARSGFETRS